MNNKYLAKGSAIAIPVTSRTWALGQIIFPGVSFYLGVGLFEFPDPPLLDQLKGLPLELYSWTNDAEIYRGGWRNIGCTDVQENKELPEYKVEIDGKMMVESFYGDIVRYFDPLSDYGIDYKKIRSPLLIQDAVQAALGHGSWLDSYELMLLS